MGHCLNGTVVREYPITVGINLGNYLGWQQQHWPGMTETEEAGMMADPDGDGQINWMEWALGLNPKISDPYAGEVKLEGGRLEFRYVRRRVSDQSVSYQVEWSDFLNDDWSNSGVVVEEILPVTTELERIRVTIPAGGERRFLRVRMQANN